MPFVHVTALYALPLAAAPIIIHLLNRRRFKVVEWAAMEFLLASNRRNYRRVRLEQLLLLALRVLLVVLLVLMVARPLVRRRALAAVGERRRSVVLVFDTSMSMGYRDGTLSSYDRGQAFAERLMGSLREGDSWALVLAEGRGRPRVRDASFDLDAARAAVASDGMALSDEGSHIPAALEAAADLLESVRTPTKEVYIVTDMQRVSWLPRPGAAEPEHVERLKSLSRAADVTLVDVGAQRPANLAITELRTDEPPVVAGKETTLLVEVSNFGPEMARNVRVGFLVDGFKQLPTGAKEIASGGSAHWALPHTFQTAGPHELVAELPADGLARDDRRFLAVDARESIRVLCVDGEPGGEAFTGETDFLRVALRPGASGRQPPAARASLFDPEVVTASSFVPGDLPRYDAVVLANVARLGDGPVAALARYVREGGALVVYLGDQVSRRFYNEALHRGGKGLLPCALGEAMGGAADRKHGVHISPKLGEHRFLKLFREQKTLKLSSPAFFRHYRLEGVDGRHAVRVVCRFEGGAPAVVEGEYGRGRVVVFASSADDEWNDMPSWPAYLAFTHEVFTQVARDPGMQRNAAVGEPLVAHLPPDRFGKTLRLLRPGHTAAVPLRAAAIEGLVCVTYAQTDRAGIYKLLEDSKEPPRAPSGERARVFAVNCPALESDLRRCTARELRRAFPGFGFAYQRGRASRERAAGGARAGEAWRWLAYCLLALLFVETVLAQRFGR